MNDFTAAKIRRRRLVPATLSILICAASAFAAESDDGQVLFSSVCREQGEGCVYAKEDLRAEAKPPGTLRLVWKQADGKEQAWELGAKDFGAQIQCKEDRCSLPQNTGCYAGCIASRPIPKVFDRRARRLYFTVIGFDHEVTLFSFDLDTRKAARLLEDRSTEDIGGAVLSPDRRYFAYLQAHHGSWCDDFAQVRVFDLQEGRQVLGDEDRSKRATEAGIITSDGQPRWTSNGEIELRRAEWNNEDCTRDQHPDNDRISIVRIQIPPAAASTTRGATPARR